MIFVDTGYLLALLNPRDQLHKRAANWATSLNEPLLTTEYVVWELVNGLSSPTDRAKCHAAVDDICSAADWQVVAATAELFNRGLRMHREHADKEWSLTDCISFTVMKDNELRRALAHDRHFEQAGFEALLRSSPSTADP